MKNKISSSIKFSWNNNEFDDLLKSCDQDDAVQTSLRWLSNKDSRILEAGCGLGRVVKYLQDRGYKNVSGLELDTAAVNFINKKYPILKIRQGNILRMPYRKGSFDAVLSYGVIEHFPDVGPEAPLKNIREVLRPGGVAIVSVPCQNILRQFIQIVGLIKERMFSINKIKRNVNCNGYYIYPQAGNFFEYRLTKKQFEDVCRKSGFKILASMPIAHIDGLYHIFGKKLVLFENWQFKPNLFAKFLNQTLKLIPYLHNHMQVCVLIKEK